MLKGFKIEHQKELTDNELKILNLVTLLHNDIFDKIKELEQALSDGYDVIWQEAQKINLRICDK